MRPTPAAPRHTGRLIAAIVAIPFASVTGATLVADVASTRDPGAARWGLVAAAAGVALGSGIVHIARKVTSTVVSVLAVSSRLVEAVGPPPADHGLRVVLRSPRLRAPVLVPAPTGRRGPPRVRR